MTAPEVEDLSPGGAYVERRRPPVPRLPLAAVAFSLVAGLAGAGVVRADDARRARADAHLTVSVVLARALPDAAADAPVAADAAVTLDLHVSVAVRILDAELDGAPPVSRIDGRTGASRTPSVLVHWRVLCAEVGTIPGPRLLDVDVASATGDQHRRITLATSDDDPVARVFRLSAAEACTAGRS